MLRETLRRAKMLVIGTVLGRSITTSSLMTFQSSKELRMKCKKFSERDPLLESVLYELNSKEMKTYACCKGHDQYGGYIAMKVEPHQEQIANQMATELWEMSHARISIHGYRASFEGSVLNIYFSSDEKQQVLEQMLKSLKTPNDKQTPLFSTLFECVRLQMRDHSDLMFGLYMKPEEEGISAEIELPFMFLSAKSYISLNDLEEIVQEMEKIQTLVNQGIVSAEELQKQVSVLNYLLAKSPLVEPEALEDYYADYTEAELQRVMDKKGEYVGAMDDLTNHYREQQMTPEVVEKLALYNSNWECYLEALKREESLKAKRQLTLQEAKTML